MQVDPKYTFWLGVAVTIEQAIGSGTIHLTNMIPADWIPPVIAWNATLAFIGTTLITALTGLSSAKRGPLVS